MNDAIDAREQARQLFIEQKLHKPPRKKPRRKSTASLRKLTRKQVTKVVAEYERGLSMKAIGQKFGVSEATICRALQRVRDER